MNIYLIGVLLLITAIVKFISASGNARILHNLDPVFSLPFQAVFWMVGSIELAVALVCFFGKQVVLQAALIALLATNFIVYRLGLLWIHYRKPCPCLGNLTAALHIPPQTADAAMKIILAYLLLGSYGTLFWLWRQRKNAAPLAGT